MTEMWKRPGGRLILRKGERYEQYSFLSDDWGLPDDAVPFPESAVPVPKTLPEQMRILAPVLEEATARRHPALGLWSADTLRSHADLWEREDRKNAEDETAVKELAHHLRGSVLADAEAHVARHLLSKYDMTKRAES